MKSFKRHDRGEGFGIIPTSGEMIAPEDGEITMLFETNHAIGLKTRNGAELLFISAWIPSN